MKLRNKIVYGIAALIGFLPLAILVIIQSIFALEASYDSKLVIDAEKMVLVDVIAYNEYNEDITLLLNSLDEDGKPILYSIIEATDKYVILDFHGGEVADKDIVISSIQFERLSGSKTELLRGIVYLQFKNLAEDNTDPNWVQEAWLRDFIDDNLELYTEFFEDPMGTIPYIWVKIITASLGTIIGMVTVGFVILRKSTKALVKRYWRIAVLVGLIEGTIILGLITWIVADIFQVFAAATVGWMLFLGAEKLAKVKGYLETAAITGELPDALPVEARADIEATVESILAKYRK